MRFVSLLVPFAFAAMLVGCETSVDPIVGTDRAFSMYGVIQPRSDTQWVRVYPVVERLEPTRPDTLPVRVTSTDVDRGQTIVWQDSVIREDDGRYAHVFWNPFRARYGRTYRVEVTGEDGSATRVEVPVPENAALALQEPDTSSGGASPVIVPVVVNNDVPRLINLEVEYYVQYDLEENSGPFDSPTARMAVSYNGAQQQVEAGWRIPIDLTKDFRILQERLILADLWNPEVGLVMRNMTLRLVVANEAWDPPGGEFDPNVMVEPGAMSNVEDGFGFVGAGYRLTKQWTPSVDVLTQAGWTDPAELF